ncbi:MAG: FAD-dependent oxidoreductase [Proteobacteria bacterium]|nr:FAD-dependent oxidoreductase [Pseudomonadota bacterium]MDA1057652.1 FAD-dependent oxidoreductase [Pseudomonadota bacterium]
MSTQYDVIVVGAGTAGIPCAAAVAARGGRVLLVEQNDDVGGSLHLSAGQMSGAGTQLQKERGIEDHPRLHFSDAMRISKNTADPQLVNLAVNLAPDVIDWLMVEGFAMDPECPKIFYGHEAYSVARTYWGVDGGISILEVLRRVLTRQLRRGRLELRINTSMVGLVQDSRYAPVTGVKLRGPDGKVQTVLAKNVVLTTGGYAGNGRLFSRLTDGHPLFSAGMPTSNGTGILLGSAAGGAIRNGDKFLPTFAGITINGQSNRVDFYRMPSLTPQVRPPWEIFVNLHGRRFVAEDHPSVDERENRLLEQPEMSFWIVFDDRILKEAPALLGQGGGLAGGDWTPEAVREAYATHPSFKTADTVAGLAEACGLRASALTETVADYNNAVDSGTDSLGRKHLPAKIETGPFHAIKAHGAVLKTPAGLSVNTDLQVVNRKGQVVPNLYAAGEALGGGTLSGKSFVGGMSVTPALAFGRYLGSNLLKW